MNLKTFSPVTTPSIRGVHAAAGIGVTAVGVFTLNKEAVEKLKVKAGDHVHVLQDKDNAEDWYICKVKEDGYVLRHQKNGLLIFNAAPAAREIFESVVYTGKSGRVLLAGMPTKHDGLTLYGLLTNLLKNK